MSERLLNIDLTDLGAVKLVCVQCHASAEFPLAHTQADPPERCFHCRSEWFLPDSPQATALQHLFRALIQLRKVDMATDCHVQLVMRLDRGPSQSRVPK
jgi:hypothetical protein